MTAVAAGADNSALRKTAFSPEDDLGPSPLHPARVQRLRHHLHHREHMFAHARTYREQSEGQHARTHTIASSLKLILLLHFPVLHVERRAPKKSERCQAGEGRIYKAKRMCYGRAGGWRGSVFATGSTVVRVPDAQARAIATADAIMGVSLYGERDISEFGNFARAFITLFRIASGDTWVRRCSDT